MQCLYKAFHFAPGISLFLKAASLCYILNRSINTGGFPVDWKCAKVTPIRKSCSRDNVNNYRPISVLSPIAKVFERIIYNQLYD